MNLDSDAMRPPPDQSLGSGGTDASATEPRTEPRTGPGTGPPSEVSQARRSLERTLALLWEGRPPSGRGPKPALTLEEIVDTAIAVADAEGVDAISMRRVARELEIANMSLYRYVPNLTILLELMLDRVSAPTESQRARQGQTWREVLEGEAWAGRALYLQHPWLLQVNRSRPVLGPNSVAGMELLMSGLTTLPLSDREKIALVTSLDAYVIGAVRHEVMYTSAADETGLSEEEFWSVQLPVMERVMASGAYPMMAAMAEDSFDAGWEETFVLGLRFILDGIDAEVARRGKAS